ncbi:hypothetical protein [Marinimicrobium sp. C2-29]|uniref:hypothetical protein n=1 Tax=Marinimicrobium sp. C2-29 TaxID=3139825 RepID=UPI0031386A98
MQEEQGKLPKGMTQWGPWKRWRRYRNIRNDDLSFLRDQDSEENARGRLPEDESVALPAVWVAELYTPSTVNSLLKGVRNLNWEHGKTRSDSLEKWMNEIREGRQAGWKSLGVVSPAEAAHFMSERTASLPPGARAALPILMSITPSITALIIGFIFDDHVSSSLESSLRAEFETITRKDPLFRSWHVIRYVLTGCSDRLGHSIYSPDLLRRDAVKARLNEVEGTCVEWVQKNLPGTFSSWPGSRNPTAVLLLTDKIKPMSEKARSVRALEGLALDRDYDAWESDEWPDAKLAFPRGWGDESRRLTFACRRSDAVPKKPYYHDPESNWTIAQRADSLIRGFISRWAITCLLDTYHEMLSAWRDQIAREGGYRTVRDLKDFRALARTTLYDIGICTEEIVEFSQKKAGYRFNVIEFSRVRYTPENRRDLVANLRSSQKSRARQVQREASLLQSTLSTSNQLSQTISSIRIQRVVVGLSIVSIGLAIWIGFITLNAT